MIQYRFDHHVCTDCVDAGRAHRVGQVVIEGGTDFALVCTSCGDRDGPYAGPRRKDENDYWLVPPGRC